MNLVLKYLVIIFSIWLQRYPKRICSTFNPIRYELSWANSTCKKIYTTSIRIIRINLVFSDFRLYRDIRVFCLNFEMLKRYFSESWEFQRVLLTLFTMVGARGKGDEVQSACANFDMVLWCLKILIVLKKFGAHVVKRALWRECLFYLFANQYFCF